MKPDLKTIADDVAKLSTRCAVMCAIDMGIAPTQSSIIEKMISAAVSATLAMKVKDMLEQGTLKTQDVNTFRDATKKAVTAVIMKANSSGSFFREGGEA